MVKHSQIKKAQIGLIQVWKNKTSKKNKIILSLIVTLVFILFIALKPQAFIGLWLTSDQQGQLLFNSGRYQQASKTFVNTQWQAYSAYGNEDYKNAATLYSQFDDKFSQLAQANALAHGRHYIKARNLYKAIVNRYPDFEQAKHNQNLVQKIIDEVNALSAAQQPEEGESIKELGDEPQTGDGAEKKEANIQQIEQLTSEQLLLDPQLNQMWLRQVQKDPASFLSQKFYFQYEKQKPTPLKDNEGTEQSTQNKDTHNEQ